MVLEPGMSVADWLSHLGRPLLRIGMAGVCVVAPFHSGVDTAELSTIYLFTGALYEIRRREKQTLAEISKPIVG